MMVEDIMGHFSVIGTNQDDSKNTYTGELFLDLNDDNSINAKWLINNIQTQFGKGFLNGSVLTINFHYKGVGDEIFYGQVTYKCLTKDILEGTWVEEFGNPDYIGTENCFRLKATTIN